MLLGVPAAPEGAAPPRRARAASEMNLNVSFLNNEGATPAPAPAPLRARAHSGQHSPVSPLRSQRSPSARMRAAPTPPPDGTVRSPRMSGMSARGMRTESRMSIVSPRSESRMSENGRGRALSILLAESRDFSSGHKNGDDAEGLVGQLTAELERLSKENGELRTKAKEKVAL